MTTTSFLHYCRELVLVRWLPSVTYSGRIVLAPCFVVNTEQFELALPPLEAVAVDTVGVYAHPDVLTAAKALEIPMSLAFLIAEAAGQKEGLSRDASEIRQGILDALKCPNGLKLLWQKLPHRVHELKGAT